MRQETPHSYRMTLLLLFFVSLMPFTTKLMAFYLSHPPEIPPFFGEDLLSWWLAMNGIARSELSIPVSVYGLDLLASSVTLNAIMHAALRTPGVLINDAAGEELLALQRRQQVGVKMILGTIIFGFVLPVIAVFGYIFVSALFFVNPTIAFARAKLKG